MILALLLIAVAGALTAGWIAVVTARSAMTEQMTAASQRRIALENSKALAQEFMLERVIPSISGIAFSYNLDDPAWGGISVPAGVVRRCNSIIKAAGVNHFNPGNGDGYTLDLPVTVRDGDANPLRKYQIKSRSPLLAGTLLSSQTPTITPSASIAIDSLAVSGAAFVWRPSTLHDLHGELLFHPGRRHCRVVHKLRQQPPGDEQSLAAPPDRQPTHRRCTFLHRPARRHRQHPSRGQLLDHQSHFGRWRHRERLDALLIERRRLRRNGNVTITLSDPALGDVYIPGEISTLTLTGQATINNAAADDLPAILIVVAQPSGAAGISRASRSTSTTAGASTSS